jgi:hypothetical protein
LLMGVYWRPAIVEDADGVFAEASGGTSMEKTSVFVSQPAVPDGVSLAPVEGLGLQMTGELFLDQRTQHRFRCR